MEHSKGQWRVERTQTKRIEMVEVVAGNFDVICRVNHKIRVNHINRELPQEANARLIAAAPDLLEALRDLMAEQNGPPLIRNQETWEAAMAKAEAAIKKAGVK